MARQAYEVEKDSGKVWGCQTHICWWTATFYLIPRNLSKINTDKYMYAYTHVSDQRSFIHNSKKKKIAETAHQWGDGKTNWCIHRKDSGIKSNEQVMLQRG